jgi:hypothetical protein
MAPVIVRTGRRLQFPISRSCVLRGSIASIRPHHREMVRCRCRVFGSAISRAVPATRFPPSRFQSAAAAFIRRCAASGLIATRSLVAPITQSAYRGCRDFAAGVLSHAENAHLRRERFLRHCQRRISLADGSAGFVVATLTK